MLGQARETPAGYGGRFSAHERLEIHSSAECSASSGQYPDAEVVAALQGVHRGCDADRNRLVDRVSRLWALDRNHHDVILRVDRHGAHRYLPPDARLIGP